MFNFDLNEPYIDLNSAPDLEPPILVRQNADVSAGELNGMQPEDENILLEVSLILRFYMCATPIQLLGTNT